MRRLGLACNESAVFSTSNPRRDIPPYEVLVRFGRWDEILAEPDHPEFMVFTRAFRHATRGIAYAAKPMGRLPAPACAGRGASWKKFATD
jgi:hypothetical protein